MTANHGVDKTIKINLNQSQQTSVLAEQELVRNRRPGVKTKVPTVTSHTIHQSWEDQNEYDQLQILPCSLTINITSHSMENLAFHSFLSWKTIRLPILTTSLIHWSYFLLLLNWLILSLAFFSASWHGWSHQVVDGQRQIWGSASPGLRWCFCTFGELNSCAAFREWFLLPVNSRGWFCCFALLAPFFPRSGCVRTRFLKARLG